MLLDEAVSALDKSVEAQVLNLLIDLKEELGLTYVFISHDLNVVRFISDRVIVMYLGEVVETGPVEALWSDARHPYTRALLAAMPSLDPDNRTQEAADRRRSAQPDQSAVGLPLPHALRVCRKRCAARRARRCSRPATSATPPPATWSIPPPAIRRRGIPLPGSCNMPDDVSPERVAAIAAAARVPICREWPARIARAVTPTVARYAAENIAIPLETEPSSFLVVQHKDAGR